MENLSVGKVILASFPFSDLTAKKLRPCFILGIAEFDDIVLCQITSNRYRSKRAIALKPTDFNQGSIIRNSFIRLDKIATLDKRMVRRVLGSVTESKLREVKLALKEFLEIE